MEPVKLEENKNDCRFWYGNLRNIISDDMAHNIAEFVLSLLDGKEIMIETEEQDDFTLSLNRLKEDPEKTNELLNFLSLIISSKKNIRTFVDILPDSSQKALKRLLHSFYVSKGDMEQIITPPILKNSAFSCQSIGECSWLLTSNYPAFKNSGKDSGYVSYFHFHPSVFAVLFSTYNDDADKPLKSVDTIPAEYNISNFEEKAFVDVNVVKNLYLDGSYLTRASKLIPNQVRKLLRELSLEEFHLSPLTDDVTYMRTQFVVSGMAMMMSGYPQIVKSQSIQTQNFIKAMVEKVQYHREWTFDMFLPYIRGIKKVDLDSCTANTLFIKLIQLIKHAGNGWISISELDNQLYKTINSYRIPLSLISPSDVNNRHYIFNSYSMVAVNADKMVTQLGLAFIHSVIMYLASLGCVEVACKDVDRKGDSPYDCVAFFKLTSLGSYSLSLTQEYVPPKIVFDKDYFEVDDKRLVVRSLVEDNPYLHIIADIANPFYGGRYEVTARTFLNHCSTEKDVEYKISVFKQYVCDDLPPVWNNFFERIKKHCKPLKPCMSQAFKIYQIDSDNQEIIHLLVNDVKLRSYILRCEDFYIMVKSDCQQLFEERMKELGYLL